MIPFRRSVQIVRAHLRPFLLLNALVFGLLLAGMGVGVLLPDLELPNFATGEGGGDVFVDLVADPWALAGLILLVNVFAASLLAIVVPSLVVPFLGIAIWAYYAFSVGVGIAPVDRNTALILLPHSLTLLIEFGAYVLLMLGVYLVGRGWLRPRSVGATTRRQGYVTGLRNLGRLAVPALVLLVVGAIYEGFELAYLIPALLTG